MTETFAERVAYLSHAWICGNRQHVLDELSGGRMKGAKSRAMVAALMHRMMISHCHDDAACLARTLAARCGDAEGEYRHAIAPQEA